MRTPAIVVWTKPNCVQCTSTKRFLDKHGISYTEYDLTEHPDQAAKFRDAGYATAPIIVTNTDTWAGFQYAKLHQLTKEHQ